MRHMEVIGYAADGRPIVGATSSGIRYVNPGGAIVQAVEEQQASYGPQVSSFAPAVTTQPGVSMIPPAGTPQSPNLPYVGSTNPGWRQGQLAPGVESPQEGMVPLPMAALQGSPAGTFSATVTSITWQGQLQKPFRGERFLIARVNTGTSATGLLLAQIFVGVDLQMGDITPIPIESLANGNAFGTRLTLMQAPPGVLIRVPCTLSSNPTSTDTVFFAVMILGRILH